MQFNA